MHFRECLLKRWRGVSQPSLFYLPKINNREVNMTHKVFLIQSEGLGRGDEQLGSMLMANFLRLLGDSEDKPGSMIFWNAGVRLICEGSPVLNRLKLLEEQGVELLGCATCLEHFELADKLAVGKPTNMMKSIQSMLSSEVVSL
jgi:selenium metabolism protein YedF